MKLSHFVLTLYCISSIFIILSFHAYQKQDEGIFRTHAADHFKSRILTKFSNHNTISLNNFNESLSFKEFWPIDMKLFRKTLGQKADRNRTVIIVVVDLSFVDMAINLYETSFKRHKIKNYIFLCAHEKATQKLHSLFIDAITAWKDKQGENPSTYGSLFFSKKNIYKTIAATLALEMGFTVIVMDSDIVFMRNPLPFFACTDCDMIFSTEGNTNILNAGLYVGFCTLRTIKLHKDVIKLVIKSKFQNNEQNVFNSLIRKSIYIKVRKLDYKLFQNGRYYFELGKRMFAGDNPCPSCISVHNNYILSHNHKLYRFKEHLLWMYDEEEYYSSDERNYILYENKYYIGEKETMIAEEKALKNAFMLGYLLNRTVILPKFFCYLCTGEVVQANKKIPMCAANIHFSIKVMDNKLKNRYRENMFLLHPKVPKTVKSSISEVLLFTTNFYIKEMGKTYRHITGVQKIISSENHQNYFSANEIITSMIPFEKYRVVQFHSLYGDLVQKVELNFFNKEIFPAIKSIHSPNYKIIKFLNRV